MSPALSERPNLASLDPDTFAKGVVHAVTGHVQGLWIRGARDLPPPEDFEQLRAEAHALALYAQRGEASGDFRANRAVHDLYCTLYGSPIVRDPAPPLGPTAEDPQDLELTLAGWFRLVSLAAWARHRLGLGKPVYPSELAALTDSSADYIRQKVRRGELVAVEGPTGAGMMVDHASALAWAEERGAISPG